MPNEFVREKTDGYGVEVVLECSGRAGSTECGEVNKEELGVTITRLPEKITHIGLIVEDIGKAQEELRNLYGPLPGLNTVYDFYPDSVWGPEGKKMSEKCQIRICMIEWVNGLKMELLQPILGTTEHARFIREFGGGMHHVAYYVKDNFSEYRSLLLKQGARILFESETEDGRGHRRCCYLLCPGTHMVYEIAEPPKD